MSDPLCYTCIHRREVINSCHSRCAHPVVGNRVSDAAVQLVLGNAKRTLKIAGNPHGVRKGWFAWPFNFDPVWLNNCEGYEQKEKPNHRRSHHDSV